MGPCPARFPFMESLRTMGYEEAGHVQEIGYGCHNDVQILADQLYSEEELLFWYIIKFDFDFLA